MRGPWKMDTCLIAGDLPLNNVSTSATVYLQMILLNYASSAIIEASQATSHFVLWLLSRILTSAVPVFYTDMRGRGGGGVLDGYISLQTVK